MDDPYRDERGPTAQEYAEIDKRSDTIDALVAALEAVASDAGRDALSLTTLKRCGDALALVREEQK